MERDSLEAIVFQRFCDIRGRQHSLGVGRRNGRITVFFSRQGDDVSTEMDRRADFSEQPKLFVNLNRRQADTWKKILRGQSISGIADEEGVSRQAIYSRIQGDRNGNGGMISKNYWVLLWWRVRRRVHFSALNRVADF